MGSQVRKFLIRGRTRNFYLNPSPVRNEARRVSPLKIDPSLTAGIRRAFMRDFVRRVEDIRRSIVELVLDEDAFGLREDSNGFMLNWNPNQPRVPAGSGDPSGQWTSGGGDTKIEISDKLLDKWKLIGKVYPDRQKLDQLIQESRDERGIKGDASAGLCDQVSITLWDKLGKPKDLYPYSVMLGEDEHVILYHKKTGIVIDPTADQFGNKFVTTMEKSGYKILGRLTQRDIEDIRSLYVQNHLADWATNTRWKWNSNAQKVKAFKQWLEDQIRAKILTSDEVNQLWTKRYIQAAYDRGRVRGRSQAARLRRKQFLEFTEDTVSIFRKREELYARSFEDLDGFSKKMATDASRTVLDSLSREESPRTLARKLSRVLNISKKRAMVIARTEIVHAQAEGQLDEMEEMGITGVSALVELVTAGDNKVCPQCQSLSGVVFTIKQARGVIPVHPSCRCGWAAVTSDEVLDRNRIKSQRRLASRARARRIRERKSGRTSKASQGQRFKSKQKVAKRRRR